MRTTLSRLLLLSSAVLVSASATAEAQVWYRPGVRWGGPAVGFTNPYYGYGNYGTGLGDVIRSQGEYNLNTSEAMINYEDARSKYIDNSVKWTQAYHERQRMGKAAQEEKYAAERAARNRYLASKQSGAPPRLTPSQLDPTSGKIYWPSELTGPEYSVERKQLEELFLLRAHTGATSENSKQIYEAARVMQDKLKAQIRDLLPNDYLEARKFLESMSWEAQYSANL